MNLCVYCGASSGADSRYAAAARELGQHLGQAGHTLVYGGGAVGLMGEVATAALAAGGRVIGVITQHLADLELAHPAATEMHVVQTMHERKAMMGELADAFVALPGGYGTLEELFEVLTWHQLGLHPKPVALYDVAGFWQPLLQCLDHLKKEAFVSAAHREMLLVAREPKALLDQLQNYEPRLSGKWLS
jgi:uncharacterized protein (TIGR00730 family)